MPYSTSGRASLTELIERVRGEYIEMPGLALTPPQAERLMGLDNPLCERIFSALVEAGFLRSTDRGYIRCE